MSFDDTTLTIDQIPVIVLSGARIICPRFRALDGSRQTLLLSTLELIGHAIDLTQVFHEHDTRLTRYSD